jgi:hypothetical protein
MSKIDLHVGVISDTQDCSGRRQWRRGCDLLLHAGDVGDEAPKIVELNVSGALSRSLGHDEPRQPPKFRRFDQAQVGFTPLKSHLP